VLVMACRRGQCVRSDGCSPRRVAISTSVSDQWLPLCRGQRISERLPVNEAIRVVKAQAMATSCLPVIRIPDVGYRDGTTDQAGPALNGGGIGALVSRRGRSRGAQPVADAVVAGRGMPTAQVAAVTGYGVRWIQEIARRYRAEPEAIGDQRHTNPGATPLLDATQQAVLHQALAGPAPDGGSGVAAAWRPG
jgi:hypothetical protein